MKTLTISVLTFCFCISGHTEKIQGIGIAKVDFDSSTVIHFYSSLKDDHPAKTVEFYNDKTVNSWRIKRLEEHRKWLLISMNLDYSIFEFQYITEKDGWLEVIVDPETSNTFWIKKSDKIEALTWGEYIKDMFGIGPQENSLQEIKRTPDMTAEKLRDFDGCYSVKSVKGDWIELFTSDYCEDFFDQSEQKIETGWVKWREGDELLVELYPFA